MDGNDLTFVRGTMRLLAAAGIITWLFGGWAEELLGLRPPGPHKDLDLLYPAEDFALLDALLSADSRLTEIGGKRFAHKRAFLREGVMTELFLVRSSDGQPPFYTDFWGRVRHEWPDDVLTGQAGVLRVASAAAVAGYRVAHDRLVLSARSRSGP